MSQLQTSLVLSGDASGLVRAGQQSEAVLERIERATGSANRSFKSAKDSASAFTSALDQQTREVDQLRQSIDPLYAANRRLEAGQALLTRAHAMGELSVRDYRSALGLLEAQHRRVTMAADLQATATGRLTTMTRGGAGGMQNFSYQLQDVFTQVGMGVPLMVSLGQQAPQILSGFGSVGAILGVVAAGALPLAAAVFGLGYNTRQAADDVQTAEELITQALSDIDEAQAVLRENSVDNLDVIKAKYGEVTREVLTLMQAQNDLKFQETLTSVTEKIESTFGNTSFDDLDAAFNARRRTIAELQREISALEATIPVAIDPGQVRRQIDQLQSDLALYAAGEDIRLDFGVDETAVQNILIFENAIKSALEARNFDGLLTTVIQLREELQGIPDGPLSDMLPGIVSVEDALRKALVTSELHAETQAEIEQLLLSSGSVDVSSNLAAAAAQASRIADELGRAVSNAIALANQGVGDVDRARINYEFRDDPIGRAGALANAEFNAQTQVPAGADSTIVNVIERERREFVGARVEAERYNQSLQEYRRQQAELARSSGSGAGSGTGGASARGGSADEDRDRTRIMREIERDMARLAPSYARDIEELNAWRSEALSILDPAAAGYDQFAADVEFIFQDRLARAYDEDLQRRTDWMAGIERGLAGLNEDMMTWADLSEGIVTDWSAGLEDQFASFVRTGKFSVDDLVDHTLEQFARLAFQQALQPGLEGLFNMALGAAAGAFGAGAPSGAATGVTVTQSHAGSQIGAGGVRRTYGPGAPLRADERLTVTTVGQRVFTPEQLSNGATVVDALAMAAQANARGGQPTIQFSPQFSIQNNSSAQLQGDMVEESDGQGNRRFTMVFADQVGTALTTKGGGAARAMRQQYGLRKPGSLR